MAKVILFGLNDYAELAQFYLQHDTEHEVVAFSVSQSYMPLEENFLGLPVVPFETVQEKFAPGKFYFFAPMAVGDMNQTRAQIYQQIKDKGYNCISYVSSKATKFPGAVIGENCFILEDNTLQPFTSIGDNVVLWSGNHIGHHGSIGNHVTITSHVVISGHCEIRDFCFLGVNSTVRDGLTLAEGSLVAMGALLTIDTDPWSVYVGSPAKKGKKSSKEIVF